MKELASNELAIPLGSVPSSSNITVPYLDIFAEPLPLSIPLLPLLCSPLAVFAAQVWLAHPLEGSSKRQARGPDRRSEEHPSTVAARCSCRHGWSAEGERKCVRLRRSERQDSRRQRMSFVCSNLTAPLLLPNFTEYSSLHFNLASFFLFFY
jgi:hypothetical protein